jgi:hypothetical protein
MRTYPQRAGNEFPQVLVVNLVDSIDAIVRVAHWPAQTAGRPYYSVDSNGYSRDHYP